MFNVVFNDSPFKKAAEDDKKYKMLIDGKNDEFFAQFKTKVEPSQEFKELIVLMLSHVPSKRPNISQIRDSKWMKPFGN